MSMAAEMRAYRLSPDLAVESFGEQALVLLADRDRILTVNRAAADLLALLQQRLDVFTCDSLAALLADHYEMTAQQAAERAARLIASWEEYGILRGDGQTADKGET
jgi:PAS domain-containing protein